MNPLSGIFKRNIKKSPAALALLLLVLTMIVFLAGGWFVFELEKKSREEDLGQRLVSIGNNADAFLFDDDPYYLLSAKSSEEVYLEDPFNELSLLREDLEILKEKNSLRSVMIIDDNLHVMVDAAGKFIPGEKLPVLEIDDTEIQAAFRGESSTTPYYEIGENPFKRAYIPLRNLNNDIIGVMRLEAGRDYFHDLNRVKNAMSWIGGIVLCLLLLVILLFYRLLNSLLKTEETLAFTDRMNSLGTMAAGLAHEIRNPLGIIRINAETISEELPSHPEHQDMLKDIVEETERLNQLVTQFLQFASPRRSQAAVAASPSEIAHSVVSLLKKELQKKEIQMNVQAEDNVTATIDEKSLRQILLNLILNAEQAVNKNGSISLEIRRRKKKIIIEVKDDGKGISPEKASRIFDPFYTAEDRGTGLGLFITRMLVDRAGGEISCHSEPGKGTSFTVILPGQNIKERK